MDNETDKGEAVVEMEDVSFSYDGTPALEDVNLALRHREFVSVVGPNGGGKTTLVKLLLGLIRPSKGRVRVFGKRPEDVRRRIGYMPQDVRFDARFPVTVLDVVLMGQLGNGLRFGYYRRSQKSAAVNALREVDLCDLRKKPLSSLSGGQKRRVLIARALASEPDLLLLDEPTANLDLLVEQELHALLKKLSERLTVVMVSHDLAFVSRYVDCVVCVNRTVAVHPTAEIDGEMFSRMFGGDIRMVMHDRHFRGEGRS
jgi:zinc transport system ATP-binding protein